MVNQILDLEETRTVVRQHGHEYSAELGDLLLAISNFEQSRKIDERRPFNADDAAAIIPVLQGLLQPADPEQPPLSLTSSHATLIRAKVLTDWQRLERRYLSAGQDS